MKTRLRCLSAYFLFGGISSALQMISAGIGWGVFIDLALVSIYLYYGLRLRTLLPKWKRAIQIFVAFMVLSNFVVFYFAADITKGFTETDAAGKFFMLLIFIIPATISGFVIYNIELLSKQLSQPSTETHIPTISVPPPPLADRFYTNNYFLLGLPFVVVLISNISFVLPYLNIPWKVIEVFTISTIWGAFIFAGIYFSFGFYWLFKRRYKQAGLTFLGVTAGVVLEYMLVTYWLTRFFGIE